MNVKFVTLRTIWTLGGQIYGLDALRPTEIDCIVLEKEGLGESFMGLGESVEEGFDDLHSYLYVLLFVDILCWVEVVLLRAVANKA